MGPLVSRFEYIGYRINKDTHHHGPATNFRLEYTSVIVALTAQRLGPEAGTPRSRKVGNGNHPTPRRHVTLLVPIDNLSASDGLVEDIG